MEQGRLDIPWLSPEQLADPRTKVVISGLEWELWQVANIYDVDHPLPSAGKRTGATAKDVRQRFTRRRNHATASSSRSTDTPASPVSEGQPLPDSPTLPPSVPVPRPHSVARGIDGHTPGSTQDLIDFITAVMGEFSRSAEEDGTEGAATGSARAKSTSSTASHGYWHPPLFYSPPSAVDHSFPPPPHPPPNQPLPRPPTRASPATHHRGMALNLSLRAAPELPEPSEFERDNDSASVRTIATTATRGSEPSGISDSGSDRTITPATSRQQLLAVRRGGTTASAATQQETVAVTQEITPAMSSRHQVSAARDRTAASSTAREQPVAATRKQTNAPAARQVSEGLKDRASDDASWQQRMQVLREQTAALKARQQLLFGIRQEQIGIQAECQKLHAPSPAERAVTPRAQQRPVVAPRQQAAAPKVSQQQPAAPTQGQGELAVPRVRAAAQRPAGNHEARRAPPVSILRHRPEGSWRGQDEADSSEHPRRQLQPNPMPLPLPHYDFLNHPPDFSQQPIHDDREPAMTTSLRPSPPPMNRFRSMSNLHPSDSSQRPAHNQQAEIGPGASANRFFSASSTPTPSVTPAVTQQARHDRRLGTMGTPSSPQLNKNRSPSKLPRPSPDSLQKPASPIQRSPRNQHAGAATETSPPSSKPKPTLNQARSFSNFLKKRPSFFNRPSDLAQEPSPQEQKSSPSTRASPPSETDKTSPSQSRTAAKTTPATPTKVDDDEQPKSHWSDSDSEPELTKMQKVKRVLSFARLRPKKSQAFRSQSGNQSSKSSTSIGYRTSGSSGTGTDRTRSGSKGGN